MSQVVTCLRAYARYYLHTECRQSDWLDPVRLTLILSPRERTVLRADGWNYYIVLQYEYVHMHMLACVHAYVYIHTVRT
jgi:hypothetical protein